MAVDLVRAIDDAQGAGILIHRGEAEILSHTRSPVRLDRHVYDIPLDKIAPTAKIAMAAKIMFTCAASFTRLSLLFFYYRLVQDTGKRWFLWAIHANVAFTIAIFITFFFLSIFQCTPVSNYWRKYCLLLPEIWFSLSNIFGLFQGI